MKSALLAEKVAVVTGGSQGLGLAIAQTYAAAGARLVLVGRNRAALDAAAREVAAIGGEACSLAVDINAAEAAAQIAAGAAARFGRWDILVNSAGAFVHKRFLDLTEADWQLSLGTNLTAPFRLTQTLVRHLVEHRQEGAVINIGSIHGSVGDGRAVPQCASKSGLVGFTKAAAEACREYGVRVNAIAPGAIESASAGKVSFSAHGRITQADVAALALYLASDHARCVTGVTIEAFGLTRPVISNSG